MRTVGPVLPGDAAIFEARVIDILGIGPEAIVTLKTPKGVTIRMKAYYLYAIKKENRLWVLIRNIRTWFSLVLSEIQSFARNF